MIVPTPWPAVGWFVLHQIVRNTLGVGPCEYILDVEGQKQEHVGRATCHVRTLLGDRRRRRLRQGELDDTELDYVDGIFSLGAAAVFVGYMAVSVTRFVYQSWEINDVAQGMLPLQFSAPGFIRTPNAN